MPPKKKYIPKARKAELVFLERPQERPIHCYAAPLPSAKNPRRVPTKPVDQNTSAAWVCPQFETTKSVVLKACQKKHRGLHKPQNQDGNYSLLHAGGAGRRACRFPPLTFENPEGHAVCPSGSPTCLRKNPWHSCRQPKKGAATEANVQVNASGNCTETPLFPAPQDVEPQVFGPPDAETAQVLSVRNWRSSSTPAQVTSHAWHPEEALAFGVDPGGSREPAAVLVTDTPEQEYGVKVTWRRRPHLMKHLRERG
ncbi:Uncharacterized protein C12orf32, partial [Chaetura pelagica]